MAPSRNETPIDEPRTPNPVRLNFFKLLGRAAAQAVDNTKGITDSDLAASFIGVEVAQALMGQGVFFWKDGELVDLSRFEGEREEPHQWLR